MPWLTSSALTGICREESEITSSYAHALLRSGQLDKARALLRLSGQDPHEAEEIFNAWLSRQRKHGAGPVKASSFSGRSAGKAAIVAFEAFA
jgi:hypothetical protein